MISQADAAEAIRAYNDGVRAIQEGDSDTAFTAWRRAVELDPGMVPALRNLVVYYEERDRTADVIATYDALLAHDPFDTDALIRQASAFRRSGKLARAISNYEQAIAIYPYFRFWYDELATLYDQLDQTDDGEIWRTRAKALDTDEAEMAFEDAVRQQRGGNDALAATIFEAVLEDQPANLEARIHLAGVLRSMGRPKDALAQLDQAFELTDSAPALVLFHRGRLRAELGDKDGAVADLRAALDAQPRYGRAVRLLESLGATPAPPTEPVAKPADKAAPSSGPRRVAPPAPTPAPAPAAPPASAASRAPAPPKAPAPSSGPTASASNRIVESGTYRSLQPLVTGSNPTPGKAVADSSGPAPAVVTFEIAEPSPARPSANVAAIIAYEPDEPTASREAAPAAPAAPAQAAAPRSVESIPAAVVDRHIGTQPPAAPGRAAGSAPDVLVFDMDDRASGTSPFVDLSAEPGRVREQSAMSGPILPPPPADLSWLEQLHHVVSRAASLASRTGQAGRIAVFLEADARLVPLANAVLQLVAQPDLGLYTAEHSRAYFIEAEARPGAGQHGVASEGWFGTQYFEPAWQTWGLASGGMPLDRMLESAQLAVGSDGFNLLLMVTTGRVRADQTATASFMRHVPTYQVAVLTLSDGSSELGERLVSLVPNLVTVVAADHH